jgi:hypothetical protein
MDDAWYSGEILKGETEEQKSEKDSNHHGNQGLSVSHDAILVLLLWCHCYTTPTTTQP